MISEVGHRQTGEEGLYYYIKPLLFTHETINQLPTDGNYTTDALKAQSN